MQLSSLKIKKFLIFGEMEHYKKPSEISEGNIPSLIKKKKKKKKHYEILFIFRETKISSRKPKKNCYVSEGHFLNMISKHFLYFSKKILPLFLDDR